MQSNIKFIVKQTKLELFNIILKECKTSFINMNRLVTTNGNTQMSERISISMVRDVLTQLDLSFTEAGSQQPYDFRIKMPGDNILLLEVKKTSNKQLYFNDTLPTEKAFYIVLFTGIKYKTKDDILPRVFGVNGSFFTKNDPWLDEFVKDLDSIKTKWIKHENNGMSVYPRPTYKFNMKYLLCLPEQDSCFVKDSGESSTTESVNIIDTPIDV